MADVAQQSSGVHPRAAEGIACVMFGMLMFVFQDGMMKSLIGTFPVWTLMSVRGFFAFLILAPVIWYMGGPHRLITPLWPLHLSRGLLLAIAFACFYSAFPFMGLAEVSTIYFSAPLMIAVLAVVFLGEKIGVHRIAALVIGFVGVIIAMNPKVDGFRWVTVLPLICALGYAASQIIARRIGDRDTALTAGLHSIVYSSIFLMPVGWLINQIIEIDPEFRHLGWHFPPITIEFLIAFALLALLGTTGNILLSRGYQVTSASLVAPFDYSYLPFAALMAYFLWEEVPTVSTFVGMGLIVGSGIYLGYRELVSNRRNFSSMPVTETIVAPGSATVTTALHPEKDG
ncbi:MAG: DMT family transporter [Pseudomonadota bacterium]